MKILVVDDDPGSRTMLKRLLTRDFDCRVTEAENGLEALARLDEEHFSALLLDLYMPVMGGLETLEMIRQSAHSSLPVLIMTAERGEAMVKRAVALGITDYLVKPLKPNQTSARLAQALQTLRLSSAGQSDADSEPVTVDERLVVLVAEGDPDYRCFLMDFFRPRCTALEASTGADALTLCLQETPGLVFVGGELGIIDAETLVQKVRGMSALSTTRVIATVPRSRIAETKARGAYDGVIACSFVRDVFLDQFERLTVLTGRPAQALERIFPRFRMGLIAATEKVCDITLTANVEVDPELAQVTGETLAATMLLTPPEHQMTVEVTLQLQPDVADAVTRRMGDYAENRPFTDEDRTETLSELLKMILGRVQNTLAEHGVPSEIGPSETGRRQAPVATDETGAIMTFKTEDGLRFDLIAVARKLLNSDAAKLRPYHWADKNFKATSCGEPSSGTEHGRTLGIGKLLDRLWPSAKPKAAA